MYKDHSKMILPPGKFDKRGVSHSRAEAKYQNDKLEKKHLKRFANSCSKKQEMSEKNLKDS